MNTKKPAKHGLDYIRGANWIPRQFTRAGVQREANRIAERSGMHGATAIVSDCGGYWRINVAAQPW